MAERQQSLNVGDIVYQTVNAYLYDPFEKISPYEGKIVSVGKIKAIALMTRSSNGTTYTVELRREIEYVQGVPYLRNWKRRRFTNYQEFFTISKEAAQASMDVHRGIRIGSNLTHFLRNVDYSRFTNQFLLGIIRTMCLENESVKKSFNEVTKGRDVFVNEQTER